MVKTKKVIICDSCGKKFKPGNNPEGLPNGIGFEMQDGKIINYCRNCIIEFGGLKNDFNKLAN